MKGKDFIRRLGEVELKPITIITSPDSFLLDLSVQRLEEVLNLPKKVYFADETKGEDTLLSSTSPDLFNIGRNLVVVRHAERWGRKDFEYLFEHAHGGDPIVLLVEGGLPRGVSVEGKENVLYVEFSEYRRDSIEKWVRQKMKVMGLKVSQKVEEKILMALPPRLGEIVNELEKLKLLVGERPVEEDDLKVMVHPEQFNLFQLVDCLFLGKRKGALEILRSIADEPYLGVAMVGLLFKVYMQYLAIKSHSRELLSVFPVPPWKRKQLENRMSSTLYGELSEGLIKLLEWDIRAKSGYWGSQSAYLLSFDLGHPLRC